VAGASSAFSGTDGAALDGPALDGPALDGPALKGAALEGAALAEQWHRTLGLMAPKTVLPAGELIMLPNGKPDRLAMIDRLNALHHGK
jgi:O-succinylbenzoic acid--CoA ligase